MTNQQKGFVLIGLLLAWGSVTAYQTSEFSESGSNNLTTVRPQAQSSSLPSVKDLALEEAFPNARTMAAFSQPRNIFAPRVSRKMLAKQQVAMLPSSKPIVAQPKSAQPRPPRPPGPTAAELATERARQQLNRFRFLGYLTKGGESQAFLTNEQAIYIVKQGEMLDGRVQVNKISPDIIVLSTQVHETGNHVQATIPLTPKSSS